MGKFIDTLADTAMGGLGGAVGGILGMAFQGANDRRQIRQQQKLQDMQIAGSKALTDYNYAKQLQMWKDTNYSAQMDELKKAGLNPALLYGMSGGGGVTSGSGGGSVSGANAPVGGGEIGMGIQMAMQSKLMKAQIDNINADTAKKQAETTNTGVQTDLNKLELDLKNQTFSQAKGMIEEHLIKISMENQNLQQQNHWNEATMNDRILQEQKKVIEIAGRVELMKAQTNLSQEQADNISKEMALKWAQLANEKDKTNINKGLAEFETSFGKQASNILGQLLQFIPFGRNKKGGGITIQTINER